MVIPITSFRSPLIWTLRHLLQGYGIVAVFALFCAVMAFQSDSFLTLGNITSVLRQASIQGIMALGATYVIIAGEIDLSIGSLLSFCAVLAINLHNMVGPTFAILAVLAVGLAVGVINGLLVAVMRLNSLIVTLAMLSILQGLTFLYTGGNSLSIRDPAHTWFAFLGQGSVFAVPVPVLVFILLAISLQGLLRRTIYGRWLLAVGGNPVASRYTGINCPLTKLTTFALSGATTSMAALILVSRVMSAQNQAGAGYELQVVGAVLLGGTSLLGGSGSIFKTVLGVVILAFVRNGMLLMGSKFYEEWLVTAAILFLTVWFDLASRKAKAIA
jgi:ribose transport system permease protein